MKNSFIISLKVFVLLTIVLGFIYPASITLVAQFFFPEKAHGSLIERNGQIIGSKLLSQKTLADKYFWARPSASDYGANPSGASNLGPTSKALKNAIDARKSQGLVADLLFSSASGLDPHISLDAALSQVSRIVQSRHLSEDETQQVVELVHRSLERREFGIFGEPRINVLLLNIGMDNTFVN
jgi:potassium-transporting ATPase KdpC subunit